MDIEVYLGTKKKTVDKVLDELLPPENSIPATIHRAMRYSVFAGGKRIRPILALASADLFGGNEEIVIRPACALELIHTYSLIHDDLPALDNDDLRRGKATCHKKFGEAIAVLAGDALLTYAFEILSRHPGGDVSSRIILEVSRVAGTDGMIGGQVADLEAENRKITLEELKAVHERKTGALILISFRLGGILSGASEKDLSRLDVVGKRMGMLFQIIDDLLDIEGNEELTGKRTGSDAALNKATYPALLGVAEARKRAEHIQRRIAEDLDEQWGSKSYKLAALSRFLLNRQH